MRHCDDGKGLVNADTGHAMWLHVSAHLHAITKVHPETAGRGREGERERERERDATRRSHCERYVKG